MLKMLVLFVAVIISASLLSCGGDQEPANSIDETSSPTLDSAPPTPTSTIDSEPLGFNTPDDLVDTFFKVVEVGDLPTYKRLIHHCPTHQKAMEEMGNLHRTLGFSTADDARQNYLNKVMGVFVKAFNQKSHQKYVEINGDDAVVVFAAVHGDVAGYAEIRCKRIAGRWYLAATREVLDTTEYERKYPIDRLKNTKESEP